MPRQRTLELRALKFCKWGLFAVAWSTAFLPWYGLRDPAGTSSMSPSFGALSSVLSSPGGLSPGRQDWGFMVLGGACAIAIVARLSAAVVHRNAMPTHRMWLSRVIAVATAVLLVLVVLGVFARPLYGDGPELQSGWGAVVATLAASMALIGAMAAVAGNAWTQRHPTTRAPAPGWSPAVDLSGSAV